MLYKSTRCKEVGCTGKIPDQILTIAKEQAIYMQSRTFYYPNNGGVTSTEKEQELLNQKMDYRIRHSLLINKAKYQLEIVLGENCVVDNPKEELIKITESIK